jgi:deoxyribose-phosphate aldolase
VTTNRPFTGEQEIARLIDHTLLKPEATETDIVAVCRQALQFQFASVCVNPAWVSLVASQLNVASELNNSKVKTCSVIGFPLGASRTSIKVDEAKLATGEGASEIDMVINIGALRSGHSELVASEIEQLASAVHAAGAILKVILETCLLTDHQKVLACELAKDAGADFVKTSTGFSTGGATESDVALMRATVGPDIGVKASGGVRTLEALTLMVHAGASRIGTSSGVQIISEFRAGVPANSSGAGGSY